MSLSDRYSRVRKAHRSNNRPRPPMRSRIAGVVWGMWRIIRSLALIGVGAGVVGAGVLGWLYKTDVVDDPGDHISRAAIQELSLIHI